MPTTLQSHFDVKTVWQGPVLKASEYVRVEPLTRDESGPTRINDRKTPLAEMSRRRAAYLASRKSKDRALSCEQAWSDPRDSWRHCTIPALSCSAATARFYVALIPAPSGNR
jgi:hypothetical protein